MAKSWSGWYWHLCLASWLAMGGAIASSGDCALGQNITLDGSLGSAGTLTGPDYVIPQAVGQTVGSNLFHSFGQFSLDKGESAGFISDANIRNILSRVTGGSASLIDGLIYTQSSNVNLFLINPRGILFGPNARLDVGGVNRGSFVATTVDALVWSNGGQFSATNPGGADSLLTIVGDPSGFISSLRPPKPITSSLSTLRVYEGQSLLLLGGDVTLDSSSLYVNYFEGGRIDLGGVAGAGTVGLNVDGNNLRLSFPDDVTRADVSITNGTVIDVVAEDGGSVAINARNLDISGASSVSAGIGSGLGSVDSQAGDIEINATGTINLTNDSFIANEVLPRAVGNSGNIRITTGSLSLTNGAQIVASTLGQGDAGSVTIAARDTVSFDGVSSYGTNSAALSTVEAGAVGNSGGINITTGSLSVTNGAGLDATTKGQGYAGSVTINARDTVSLDTGIVFSIVADGAVGNGSGINITTGSLSVTNGAQLSANTKGQGDAGSVTINARDTVSLDGVDSAGFYSAVYSGVEPGAVGNSGDIRLTTGSLSVTNGARLSASTQDQGDAGNVTINARDTVSLDGVGSDGFPSGVFSTVGSRAVGNGGSINITTGSLALTNGAFLGASTFGKGDAGSMTILARDTVSFDGVGSDGSSSAAYSTVESGAVGKGGDIDIRTGSLSVMNGALLSASTRGQGNGGNITLNANTLEAVNGGQLITTSRSFGKVGNITLNVTKSVALAGSDRNYNARLAQFGEEVVAGAGSASGLFANTSKTSTAQGGDLRITTGQLIVRDEAEVTVSSEGSGNAGNLEIASRDLLLDNRGSLRATTLSGEGGNIELRSQDLILMRHNSEISTVAGGTGNGGNIDIDTDFIVAVPEENSDIVADAYEGNGGNINITTQGIFGTQFREDQTPESDITASSTFGLSGEVEINTPDVDPSRGLVALPAELVDASGLIASGCGAGGTQGQQSEFIVTGRGGLPPNPSDTLSSDAVWIDLDSTTRLAENRPSSREAIQITKSTAEPLVEATGWAINDKGQVVLSASRPTATPHSPGLTTAQCHVP